MTHSLEKVDLLKERANISYREAAELLDRFDGNVVDALIYIEKQKEDTVRSNEELKVRTRLEQQENTRVFVQNIMQPSLIIRSEQRQLLEAPLLISGIIALITFPFSVLFFIGLAFTGHRFIIKTSGKVKPMDKIIRIVREDEEEGGNSTADSDAAVK